MNTQHTFHIPVMGTAFSIDTPLKVAKYGISSVISLVDDTLIEQVRRFYCEKLGEHYQEITKHDEDYRARRITEYLNLIDRVVKKQVEELKQSAFEVGSEITKYFEMLPDDAPLKILYQTMLKTIDAAERKRLQETLRASIVPGDINVNIMTKLDRTNYASNGTELPSEFSDALAALRGYAKSTVHSAIIFSAGINRRLYSYIANFNDFFADATGYIKKRIVIKVSDYRSSFTQGKFLAKKGLWVSEYRIESGLNCGGHVFPAAGELMGPILNEFKIKRQELIETLHKICNEAWALKNFITFPKPLPIRITAQGGIGTASENAFLLNHYQIDATGWGTPFLLCPEVTNVDDVTLKKLSDATEDDLYTSDVSPLGVPFNNLRDNLSDMEKDAKTQKGRPGSPCPKGHLVSNTEFTAQPICTASRQYQKLKIDQLDHQNLDPVNYQKAFRSVVQKACICSDLGDAILVKNNIFDRRKQLFPAVCPGPNMAYFSKITTLKEMVDHIYGRANVLNGRYRPHMFIKELMKNLEFFQKDIEKFLPHPSIQQVAYLVEFRDNLLKGIEYYYDLFPKLLMESRAFRNRMIQELGELKDKLLVMFQQVPLTDVDLDSAETEAPHDSPAALINEKA